MNERDPITEWEDAIKKRIGEAIILLILLAFALCLIAPSFLPIIKAMKRRQYVMSHDYEELAEADMVNIRKWLWGTVIVSWTLLILSQFHQY
jgi:hypothetical protein